MGSACDIMQTFAHKDLNALFPDYDGWKWESVSSCEHPGPVFRVTRYFNYQHQLAFVAVSLEQKPPLAQISALKGISGKGRTFKGNFLLVPQGVDVSGVPGDIHILFMSSFGFVYGRLTWLSKKKNAMRYPAKVP